ncbi:ABC transporter permease [Amorphus sp. 3PC139-8]|uniref:ABC transporter permease n=1 Tax=Amorphus sp. 3PC139-8 TaxID=2735676 RepID=UPI00345DF99A
MSDATIAPARAHPGGALGELVSLRTISVLVVLGVSALIIYPIAVMVWGAFGPNAAVREQGLLQTLIEANVVKVLTNTFIVVGAGGAIAMVAGAMFAWLNERTDASTGWFGEILPLMPLLVPQIAGVIGWVMLLAPRAGLLNAGIRDALSVVGVELNSGPLDIYTMGGFIAIMGLYLTPYVYLPVSSALKSLDPSLEEASRMAKASTWSTFRHVTMPAIRPALLASLLLVLMMGFAIFSVPVIIGTGANIEILSVRIYHLVYGYPSRVDLAIILGLVLTLIVQTLLLLQAWIANSDHAAQIGGKGARVARVQLGHWRLPARAALIAYILAAGVLPVLGLAFVSLQPFWTANIKWDVLGFDNYRTIFTGYGQTGEALFNSVALGIIGGTVGMLIAALLARTAKTSGGLLGRAINAITAAPAGVPHVVLAVGFVLSFSSGWLNLSGTWLILLLAYLTIFMPQAMRSAAVAVDQVGRELVEASQIFKASPGRSFRKILLPLMLPGLAAGWVILFVQMSGELTASALLAKSTNPVVGQVLLDLWQNGSFPEIAAVALIMTLINSAVVSVVFGLLRRSRAHRP